MLVCALGMLSSCVKREQSLVHANTSTPSMVMCTSDALASTLIDLNARLLSAARSHDETHSFVCIVLASSTNAPSSLMIAGWTDNAICFPGHEQSRCDLAPLFDRLLAPVQKVQLPSPYTDLNFPCAQDSHWSDPAFLRLPGRHPAETQVVEAV